MEQNLKFSKSHEWVLVEDNKARIGITDYAQEELGDIVFINLPEVGDAFNSGDVFADVESVKAVSDLYMPVSGIIGAINEEIIDSPELINEDPYESWLVEVDDVEINEELLSEEEYLTFVQAGGE